MTGAANPPSVSVVIPTFNRCALLPRMLEPLLSEADAREIVVVVDGCEDGSLELLQEVARSDRRVLPLRIENSGMDAARRAGARAASADVVLLLDDDVLVERGTVKGHARAHAAGDHLVVVGAMPVSGGPQAGARDYPRAMYAKEYRRHCEHWLRHPDSVLPTLWAGHMSLRRTDLLALPAPNPPELGRGYHSDVDFGLRCLQAGLTGVYDPSLRAEHRYNRDPEAFVRDARNSGHSLRLLHEAHPDELGPYTDAELLAGLRLPLRVAVQASTTRSWAVGAIELAIRAFGRLRLYRLQRGAAFLRKRIEQLRQLPAVPQPVPATNGGVL